MSTHDHPDLRSGSGDLEVLRAAARDSRVLVTNDAKNFVPLVEEFARRAERHFGVLLTSDRSFPRQPDRLGLLVRALERFARMHADDALVDSCLFLPPLQTGQP